MPPLDIQTLLKATVESGASDLHISAGMPPMIRLRGEMVRSQAPAQSDEESRAMLYTLMNENQQKDFQARHEIDFAFEEAFSFDGARCDRIVAGVIARLADTPPGGA